MTELQQAITALSASPGKTSAASGHRGVTSDLSIDETLLLHSIGWEPVDLVFGVSWWSIPWGSWQWQTGEIQEAATAFAGAMADASQQMRKECAQAGGTGVVGVDVRYRVSSHHIDISLSGTAVRRIGSSKPGFEFLSDLSARDFALLTRAGWSPLGLVAGASFVIAPRRSAKQWASQKGQNTELPHLTEALYAAREGAISRLHSASQQMQASGVIQVKLREGPIGSGGRIMQFVAVGTAVHLVADSHQHIRPTMVVSMNDSTLQISAESLRGSSK